VVIDNEDTGKSRHRSDFSSGASPVPHPWCTVDDDNMLQLTYCGSTSRIRNSPSSVTNNVSSTKNISRPYSCRTLRAREETASVLSRLRHFLATNRTHLLREPFFPS